MKDSSLEQVIVEARFKCENEDCEFDRSVSFLSNANVQATSKQIKANQSYIDDKPSMQHQLKGHPVIFTIRESIT